MPIILTFLLLSSFSFATVTIKKVDCPVQFEGRVADIIDEIGTGSAYSTQSVVFKTLTPLKGEVKEQVVIELLKHGPFQIEQGEEYRVQLREGRVCWIEKI